MIWMYEHQHASNFETDKKICRKFPTTNHNVMIGCLSMNMQIQKRIMELERPISPRQKNQILIEVHRNQLGNGPRILIFDKLLKF